MVFGNMKDNNNTCNKNVKTTKCPFDPGVGYVTAKTQWEYANTIDKSLSKVDVTNEYNLQASLDPNDPLYIWQLYSLIGSQPIYDIVSKFYHRVYADDEAPWFRDAFTKIAPLQHHINVQVAYWIDAMGGGKYYPGGNGRLNFHHYHNANDVMTADGAKRWMYHMRATLENDIKFADPRVKPCIIDFLRIKMMSYAKTFGWKYDDNDMVLYQ